LPKIILLDIWHPAFLCPKHAKNEPDHKNDTPLNVGKITEKQEKEGSVNGRLMKQILNELFPKR